MNKALDFNKLREAHAQGRLKKKQPLQYYHVSKKLDGHYTTVVVHLGKAKYYSSSGKEYFPASPTWLDCGQLPAGAYICERIIDAGKLGDRTKCALSGKRDRPIAKAESKYMVHDYISLETFHGNGIAIPYNERRQMLLNNLTSIAYDNYIIEEVGLRTIDQAEKLMKQWVKQGYEGIMLKAPMWVWKDTKSRTTSFMKWKDRPTADLFCIRVLGGEGKYEGLIGSLVLQDSSGRIVQVGSGLTDEDRNRDPKHFISKIIEIQYEQILDTYIQPTYIGIRYDTEID